MRKLSLLGLALGILVPCAVAFADEIDRTTYVDPVTGTRTTEVIRSSDWTSVPVARRVYSTTGYRVISPSRVYHDGDAVQMDRFPLNPRDGQEVWINGRKWEFDADDNRWEDDD